VTDKLLSPTWQTLVLGLANHLWQSTLVAVFAALLTLTLRRNHARARYWLWLVASLKFLVPFSLLVSIGNLLPWPRAAAQTANASLYVSIEEISQPFTRAVSRVPAAPTAMASTSIQALLPWIVALWCCGFLAVVLLWTTRLLRISAAMKSAILMQEGREVGALRRLERLGGIRRPIPFLLSRASLEPGIFGIARPTLIWPEGISQHLQDSHLEAILAHEIWHVRRRDNLAAALHMLVEALFWFYPLVWWLGARLVEERERACDEEVVAFGSDRKVYAESILKVCEFCLGSPLPCLSGVTGADLKKRMAHIMNDHNSHNLGFARKLLLITAATLAIAVPVIIGQATPGRAQSQAATSNLPTPVFSSVSIKLSETTPDEHHKLQMMFNLMDGRFMARGVTLQRLIQMAYRVQEAQIARGPDWINTAMFDVDAKLDPSFVAAMHQQASEHKELGDQGALMTLLADRFKLALHNENRTLLAYDLVVASGGPKLQEIEGIRTMHFGPGELSSQGTPMDLFAAQLSERLGRPVVDKTGLKGSYEFNLHWTPERSEQERMKAAGEPVPEVAPADSNGPSLFTALGEQLGLKLEPHTEPVQVLVIDHAESPTGIL
jgi:uncharacterized protein (TIGR03435 family)